MTPNFVSNINASVALSCTCRGSGNLQEECERLEESFSHNPCLSECAPPAPSPCGWFSSTPGEGRGQLCGPHWFHPSPADGATPSSALSIGVHLPSLGLSAFSHSLNDHPPAPAKLPFHLSEPQGHSSAQGIASRMR